MSAAVAEPPVAVKPSAVDYVRRLPPEEKHLVLLELLREAVAWNGETGLLAIDEPDGRPFGYFVPPKVAGEQWAKLAAEMPAGVRESMARPMPAGYDPDDCLSDEELVALRAEVFRKRGG